MDSFDSFYNNFLSEKELENVISQDKKTGKWRIRGHHGYWKARYDTKEDAENALKAYHANEQAVDEGSLSKAAATLALGTSLLFGGNKEAQARNSQNVPTKIEQVQSQQKSYMFGGANIPENIKTDIKKYADSLSKQNSDNIFVGIGVGRNQMITKMKAEDNARTAYFKFKYGETFNVAYNGEQILKEVDAKTYQNQDGTCVCVRFFKAN